MCTVSFIPVRNGFFITSNRDEKKSRKKAIPPEVHDLGSGKLVFPKDADAGGSWIAMHENGNAAVLLNGAFRKHVSQPPYRMSRGQIFLHLISDRFPAKRFEKLNLEGIEPFTLVVIDGNELYECRWDGSQRFCRQLQKSSHHIWSSATLYEEEVVQKREQWFASFLDKIPNPGQQDILDFHCFSGEGDKSIDLQMERGQLYSTVSITTVLVTAGKGHMKYLDLKENKCYERKIQFTAE